jgi:DNA-binding response OmpR family regulator
MRGKRNQRATSAFSPTSILGDACSVEIGLSPSKYPTTSSILVVDDERASAELAGALLRSQGFQVRLAGSGREALDIVAGGGVDLLILDLMMSKLDGVEVCAHIRNELLDPFLPIIITTSLQDRESRIRAKEAGADDVLVKPLDGLELLVRIDSLLRTRSVAHALLRERERMREELSQARAQLLLQQRALLVAAGASEAFKARIEAQRRELDVPERRSVRAPAVQEQLHDLAELVNELCRKLDGLSTAGTRELSECAEPVHDASEGRRAVARLLK